MTNQTDEVQVVVKRGPGRPRKENAIRHSARPALEQGSLLHVWLRLNPNLKLPPKMLAGFVRAALDKYEGGEGSPAADFEVEKHSLRRDALHLLVKADSKRALSAGMQRIALSVSRRVNGHFSRLARADGKSGKEGWVGRVFFERYEARLLKAEEIRELTETFDKENLTE